MPELPIRLLLPRPVWWWQALPPQLGSSALLALASLLPHGILPAAAPPPLPQRNPASLAVLGSFCAVLPAVSCWSALALRPAAGCAWLGAAAEPAGLQLAPLASAVLTLQPRQEAAGDTQARWATLRISAASPSEESTALRSRAGLRSTLLSTILLSGRLAARLSGRLSDRLYGRLADLAVCMAVCLGWLAGRALS